MSAFFCEVCKINVVEPLRPFVRFYGYARRLEVHAASYNESLGYRGPSVEEREAGVLLKDADEGMFTRSDRQWVDPAFHGGGPINATFWAHPIVCADARCVVTLLAEIARGDWGEEDKASYAEPTASSILRTYEGK